MSGKRAVSFHFARAAANGAAVGSYSGLVVVDADGVVRPARMIAAAERIRIEIDDVGARYPLVVDPLVAALEVTRPISSATVALSGNGEWAFLLGRLFPYTRELLHRSGSAWSLEPDSPPYGVIVASDDGARVLLQDGEVWSRDVTGWTRDSGAPRTRAGSPGSPGGSGRWGPRHPPSSPHRRSR